ncbi:hypothetical protein M153_3200011105 [Pseudoloma neurophilia]|uniref:Uncharacterized protein n=1 Tax=Pseudoloma neurophilia TaxID=146866 RepID=A0A0R0M0M4_9MICR|nr:hypothetical protein M153_3200011105 [Pseudoloma neurophilia]
MTAPYLLAELSKRQKVEMSNKKSDNSDILSLFGREISQDETNEKTSEEIFIKNTKEPKNERFEKIAISDDIMDLLDNISDAEMSALTNSATKQQKFPPHTTVLPDSQNSITNLSDIEISLSGSFEEVVTRKNTIQKDQFKEKSSDELDEMPEILTIAPVKQQPTYLNIPESTISLFEIEKCHKLSYKNHKVAVRIINIKWGTDDSGILTVEDLSQFNKKYEKLFKAVIAHRTIHDLRLFEQQIILIEDFSVWRMVEFAINLVEKNIQLIE